MFESIKVFFRDLKSEFGKVEWPSRKEVISLTIIVAALCLFTAVYIGAFDILFSKVLVKLGIF